ncbi:MAG TPA: hypothetical protein VJ972_16060 [Anaerolineales bacterium]|nr:hypothetical protein [Anaerolineales bacterium]
MRRPDFRKIWLWVIPALLTLVIEIVANNFQGDWKAVIIRGVVIFLILLFIVQLVWIGTERLSYWLKTPDQKLLILESIPSQDNNRSLQFVNREFRVPNIRVEKIYLGYEQRIALSVIPEVSEKKIEQHPYHTNWQKLKIRLDELPLELPKSDKITIDFVKIDIKSNQFYIDLEEIDRETFDIATHVFQVVVTYNVKKEMGKIKRYKVRVVYQGSNNLEIDIEHFD